MGNAKLATASYHGLSIQDSRVRVIDIGSWNVRCSATPPSRMRKQTRTLQMLLCEKTPYHAHEGIRI